MSEIVTDTGDSFTRAAGRQLALLAVLATLSVVLLMYLLNWLSASSASTASGNAVDVGARAITIAIASEPPQLDSTRATD
jgi:hypothetical protein